MKEYDFNEVFETVNQQEKMLRFERFSNKDGLLLGNFITDRIYEREMELAVAIRKINGTILYYHITDGASGSNQHWMEGKFNTVAMFERSSLGVWAHSGIHKEPIEFHRLSNAEYKFCGGGFPIRLKSGELVGAIMISNLFHIDDHEFIIEMLSEYLQVKDVPRVR